LSNFRVPKFEVDAKVLKFCNFRET